MNTETKFSGILLPHLAWRWVVTFEDVQYNILTQQAKSVDIDYMKRTVSLNFYEPQWKADFEKSLLSFIEKDIANLVIEFRAGDESASTTKAIYLTGKTVQCGLSLDYEANKDDSISMVKLLFKYDNIQIVEDVAAK